LELTTLAEGEVHDFRAAACLQSSINPLALLSLALDGNPLWSETSELEFCEKQRLPSDALAIEKARNKRWACARNFGRELEDEIVRFRKVLKGDNGVDDGYFCGRQLQNDPQCMLARGAPNAKCKKALNRFGVVLRDNQGHNTAEAGKSRA
jgi:hypothetical protein